ncbi:asparagine--tRNA ligase, partial [Candidatus Parcubacteria bacterium]
MTLDISQIQQTFSSLIGKEIIVEGWVRTVRLSGAVGFMEINDGTHFKGLQVVFGRDLANFEEVAKIAVGSAVRAKGKLVESPAAGQPVELQAKEIRTLAASDPDYPLQKKRHSLEFLRTIAHLRGRSNTFGAVFRVRSKLAFLIHSFFAQEGFVYVHTPILTANDCEGAGEMFQVTSLDWENLPRTEDGKIDFSQDFFGQQAHLTVSG